MPQGAVPGGRPYRRMVLAAALALPLWLAACDGLPIPPPGGTDGSPAAAPGTAVPAPEPQAPPPAGRAALPTPAGTAPAGVSQPPPEASPEAAAGPGPTDTTPVGAAPSAGTGPAVASELPPPSGQPPTATPSPGAGPERAPAARRSVTAYFVLLDDGGNNGVRFGCNDSLVGLQQAQPADKDPLPAAMNALLAAGTGSTLKAPSPEGGDTYNALAGSRLKFLSGSFDGTTVTVYLSGALSLGGVCDIPRLEAQLTQTALAAVGAVRAQVYLNGRPLAEVLRLQDTAGQ